LIVWAVANQKGGVGKTTTVVSLGGILAQRGYRTLLLDLDPHGSMTTYFRHDPDLIKNSIYQLFQAKQAAEIVQPVEMVYATRFKNLYLMPASTALATLDRQLGNLDGMGLVVKQSLDLIGNRYDFVIIDCPPQLGVLMVNALAACQHLIIPVQTEFLAMKGLERMLRTLVMIGRAQHKKFPHTILPVMFDQRTRASVSTLKLLQERYEHRVWRSVIPIDTLFRDASLKGIPLPLMMPRAKGSIAFSSFLDELLISILPQSGQQASA
jgi:chromosome partitioning protein